MPHRVAGLRLVSSLAALALASAILLASGRRSPLPSPEVGALLLPAKDYVGQNATPAMERAPHAYDGPDALRRAAISTLAVSFDERAEVAYRLCVRLNDADGPKSPLRITPAHCGGPETARDIPLPPGQYVISALGVRGGWASTRHCVGETGVAHSVKLTLSEPRRVHLSIRGPRASDVDSILVCTPDPALYHRVEWPKGSAEATISLPAAPLQVLAMHASLVVGAAPLTEGQMSALLDTMGEDDTLDRLWGESEPTVLVRWGMDGLDLLAVLDTRITVAANTVGVLAVRLPAGPAKGGPGTAGVREVLVVAERDDPDGTTHPWANARIEVVHECPCAQGVARIAVDAPETADDGVARVYVPRGQPASAFLRDALYEARVDLPIEDARVKARGTPRLPDRWAFTSAQAPVEVLGADIGHRIFHTDEVGVLSLPWRDATARLLGRWPGKTYDGPAVVEVLTLSGGLPLRSLRDLLPPVGKCRVDIHGASASLVVKGPRPWGTPILNAAAEDDDARSSLVFPPIPAGRAFLLAESRNGLSACVLPFRARGGGAAQLVSARTPTGGIELPATASEGVSWVLYGQADAKWQPLLRLAPKDRAVALYLPPGSYFAYAEGDGRLLAQRCDVGQEGLVALSLVSADAVDLRVETLLGNGARVLGAETLVTIPAWDEEHPFRALPREPGIDGLVVPPGRVHVRSQLLGSESDMVTVEAGAPRASVSVRLGGSR